MSPAVTSATRLAAVLGWPVAHSLSPSIHNPAFEAVGIDAVMLALAVEPEKLPAAVAGLASIASLGASVTVPHKEAVMPLCTELSPVARRIGAVNCLQFDDDRIVGHNTDAGGFVDALREQVSLEIGGVRAVLLGAGGAARAVSDGLHEAGAATVDVVARNPGKVAWAQATGWTGRALARLLADCDLLVDCTPLGLSERTEANAPVPVPLDRLSGAAVVASLVYHRETALLAAARHRGLRVMDGAGMLVHQAARAFEIWTGLEPPVEVMRAGLGQPQPPTDR